MIFTETAEFELIQAACRHVLGQTTSELDTTLDEARLLHTLNAHKLVPLLQHAINTGLKTPLSASFLKKLQVSSYLILKKQLQLFEMCNRIHQSFLASDIPIVFLKGPVLNQMLWGKYSLRHAIDIDLLVKPEHIEKADGLLQNLGFDAELSMQSYRLHLGLHRVTTKKDAKFFHKTYPIKVELHWKTSRQELFTWPKAPYSLSDYPTLEKEEYVLYLCVHAAIHGWSRITWLVDIIRFIEKYKLNIDDLYRQARAKNITPVLDEALYLSEHWLGIKLVQQTPLLNPIKLQQRLFWATQKIEGHRNPIKRTISTLFAHHICSKKTKQCLLWLQVFCGAFFINVLRYLFGKVKKPA